MKKYRYIIIAFCIGALMTGCGNKAKKEVNNPIVETVDTNIEIETKEITGDFSLTSDDAKASVDGNVYTISKAGTYTATGNLKEGQIIVDVEDAEVTIILNNTSISNSKNSPINIINASEVKIKSEEDSYNEINDLRDAKNTEDNAENAAIYATSDLDLTGKGTLVVNAKYNNGIQSKDDIKIKNVTLQVNSLNHAIKGNDSVTVESGNFVLNTTEGDGLKTENNDLSSNGKQKGNITIEDGTFDIKSGDDGIDAANEVIVNGGTINISQSVEGIEGNLVTFNGGKTYIYAKDDGINASSGNSTPLITVNGGYVDVTTPNGDTDAIDSNGSYIQNGGTVLVKGGAASGRVAGSVDVNGTITVNGGLIVALGGICETPEEKCNGYASNGTSFSQGNYIISDSKGTEVFEFTLSSNYSSIWVCGENFNENEAYKITKDGSEIVSWTQENGMMGDTAVGGFNHGGFGQKPDGFGGNEDRPNGMGNFKPGERETGDFDPGQFGGGGRPNKGDRMDRDF